MLILKLECGGPGNYFQTRNGSERISDFFRQSVAEVLAVRVAAEIYERQHDNRTGLCVPPIPWRGVGLMLPDRGDESVAPPRNRLDVAFGRWIDCQGFAQG